MLDYQIGHTNDPAKQIRNYSELNFIYNWTRSFALTIFPHQIFSKLKHCQNMEKTRKAPRVGANSSSVFAFDMHYK